MKRTYKPSFRIAKKRYGFLVKNKRKNKKGIKKINENN